MRALSLLAAASTVVTLSLAAALGVPATVVAVQRDAGKEAIPLKNLDENDFEPQPESPDLSTAEYTGTWLMIFFANEGYKQPFVAEQRADMMGKCQKARYPGRTNAIKSGTATPFTCTFWDDTTCTGDNHFVWSSKSGNIPNLYNRGWKNKIYSYQCSYL
ncbi:hypothetical protein K504DRAFT_463201 [Pleomassaria siparia CBS 279.74]|uniref:Uncharacterized protein n=1 Tax=Pleomassaria siparia CBS 279.74 TaxID=1314801 RepID=A0A6G1JU61_9PLEO|nr:hypothetical protein K504DRAFT_463201 [Pleomassaria siparia CBS 279.74]